MSWFFTILPIMGFFYTHGVDAYEDPKPWEQFDDIGEGR